MMLSKYLSGILLVEMSLGNSAAVRGITFHVTDSFSFHRFTANSASFGC